MTNAADGQMLGHGYYFEEMPVGFSFYSKGRTLTEADLNNFVNLTWFSEEMFVNNHDTEGRAIPGRPLPAGMIFTFAEGLIHTHLEGTGLAFLNMSYDVKRPTFVNDTIRVFVKVIEARVTSAGDRGLIRTENQIKNQHGETVLTYSPLRLVRLRPSA